jgi:hypothetical protein
MSASKMPLVIEHPVGVFSIEIAKGCFIRWWDGGERYVVRIEMEHDADLQLEDVNDTCARAMMLEH